MVIVLHYDVCHLFSPFLCRFFNARWTFVLNFYFSCSVHLHTVKFYGHLVYPRRLRQYDPQVTETFLQSIVAVYTFWFRVTPRRHLSCACIVSTPNCCFIIDSITSMESVPPLFLCFHFWPYMNTNLKCVVGCCPNILISDPIQCPFVTCSRKWSWGIVGASIFTNPLVSWCLQVPHPMRSIFYMGPNL